MKSNDLSYFSMLFILFVEYIFFVVKNFIKSFDKSIILLINDFLNISLVKSLNKTFIKPFESITIVT